MSADALIKEASDLAGRPVDVQQTRDGNFIVLYMCFGKKPPPKGTTPEEALERFIAFLKAERSIDPGTEDDYMDLQKNIEAENGELHES